MVNVKTVKTLLAYHIKLLVIQPPQTENEKNMMDITPYESEGGSIMYETVFNRYDLTYVISIVSQIMKSSGRVY